MAFLSECSRFILLQINLSNVTNRPLPWINVGFQHRRFLHITDLSLETGQTYSLELKCVNDAGYISETIATTFIVDTTYPYLTGNCYSI